MKFIFALAIGMVDEILHLHLSTYFSTKIKVKCNAFKQPGKMHQRDRDLASYGMQTMKCSQRTQFVIIDYNRSAWKVHCLNNNNETYWRKKSKAYCCRCNLKKMYFLLFSPQELALFRKIWIFLMKLSQVQNK